MKRKDLNEVNWHFGYVHSLEHNGVSKQKNRSVHVHEKMAVETYFKELDKEIIKKIEKADAVVGCVAWLTHFGILDALAKCKHGVSVILQKEDFLRPDTDSSSDFKIKLREKYWNLPFFDGSPEYSYRKILDDNRSDLWSEYQSNSSLVDISARCVGYKKKDKEFTLPRMHHKFLVFCRHEIREDFYGIYEPYAVWTGSFNMTRNGTLSLENAVYIHNDKVASSYYGEWFNMLMISEPLDWTSEWVEPDIIHMDDCSVIS